MSADDVVFYGRPSRFWFGALFAFVLSIGWLVLDIRSDHRWSAQPPLVFGFVVATFTTPLFAAFAIANAPRVARNGAWRGTIGLATFLLAALLDLVVLGNLYFLLGGEK